MQDFAPLQIISIVELFIATLISLILMGYIYKKYKEKPSNSSLFFVFNFTLVGLALVCVAIDRILLTILVDKTPGLIFHNIAILLSLGVIFLLDMFAFEMTYPKQIRKLAVLFAILIIAAGIVLLLNQPSIGAQEELIYADQLLFIILPLLAIPILMPTLVFFYFAIKVHEESVPQSNRSLVMGIAAIVVSVGYIFEVMGITGVLVIIVRLSFVVYTLLMYIAFTMPKWFQKFIGWKEAI
ncbi:MAG TPA: hypothetical protein VMV49_14665 [Candidatus Deferrimicrobium sp.]|nr:hypothetical protein [Candidatus Deferrimicrobium sp.]